MSAPTDRLSSPIAQPFSRPLDIDDVPEDGLERTVEADSTECEAVAQEIGLPAVLKLAARCRVTRQPGGRFHVGGLVEGSVTQTCVVSLEPFDSDVTQAIDVTFAPVPAAERSHEPPTPDRSRRRPRPEPREVPPPVRVAQGEEDPPDPIIKGHIDLGAVTVEFLTLALDFYPRKPDVQFSDVVGEAGEEKLSPFAALARLKDRS